MKSTIATFALLPIHAADALLSLSAMQPFLDRGYTGHEHMAGFGLINMNGRLYDPYLQRFLNPDPYVQAPGNAQNFNRYSYCLNNPLMYTDPSGYRVEEDGNGFTYTGSDMSWLWGILARAEVDLWGMGSGGDGTSGSLGWGGWAFFTATRTFSGLVWGWATSLKGLKGQFGIPMPTFSWNPGSGTNAFATGLNPLAGLMDSWLQGPRGSDGDFLTFNGKELVWHEENGNAYKVYNAVSGKYKDNFKNHVRKPDRGPIPEGQYYINLSLNPNREAKIIEGFKLYSDDGIQRIPSQWKKNNPWGRFRAKLQPFKTTNTYGRFGFYIHDSEKGYTDGCIEIESSFFEQLIEYGKNNPYIILIVNY